MVKIKNINIVSKIVVITFLNKIDINIAKKPQIISKLTFSIKSSFLSTAIALILRNDPTTKSSKNSWPNKQQTSILEKRSHGTALPEDQPIFKQVAPEQYRSLGNRFDRTRLAKSVSNIGFMMP